MSPIRMEVLAEQDGYVTHMDTALIGRAAQETGAGRIFKEQPLDFGAGIVMKKRLGDAVRKGEPLAVVYSASEEKCGGAAAFLRQAVFIGKEKAEIPPLVLKVIGEKG